MSISMPVKILALGFLFLPLTATAAETCYTPKEIMAEQVLRFHSEMMVTTVTCKQGSTGRDLGRAYTGVTQRYIKPIQQAEKIMIDYFAATHGGAGITHLDKMRTRLANEFGQIVAQESAPAYCAKRRDLVTYLHDSRTISLEEESLRLYHNIKTTAPACGDEVRVASNRQKASQ